MLAASSPIRHKGMPMQDISTDLAGDQIFHSTGITVKTESVATIMNTNLIEKVINNLLKENEFLKDQLDTHA